LVEDRLPAASTAVIVIVLFSGARVIFCWKVPLTTGIVCGVVLFSVRLAVWTENRPYELRDNKGDPITWEEARKLVLTNYHVPEEIKQARRRRTTGGISAKSKRKQREMAVYSTHEAAEAPQPVTTTASPR
jgi:hypothetical protein